MITYLKKLFEFRELLTALTKREVKIRYKQTSLGIVWAILQPFSLMLIFSIVFGFFLKLESQGIPYPIFYYSALLSWTFFSTSVSFGSLSVINNSNLITKIYFPREVLPFASIGAAVLDLVIASIIFLFMMLFYNTPITLNFLYLVPIFLILILFSSAIVLLSCTLVVIWRDLKFIIPLAIQVWMFASPIIYPVSKIPEKFRSLYILNPMASIIDNFRAVTILGISPNLPELLVAAIVSVIVFWLSYIFFKHNEKVFADII